MALGSGAVLLLSCGGPANLAPPPETAGNQPAPVRPPAEPPPLPAPIRAALAPAARGPDVRIGLEVGAGAVHLGGASAFALTEPDGALVALIAAGDEVMVEPQGSRLLLHLPSRDVTVESLTLTPDQGGLARVDGKDYRGALVLLPDRTGLTVVNTLGLEDYVASVVTAELGRRGIEDEEALRAQAVVSRTYAMRNMGRWRKQGFDLYGTVADQAYGGADTETSLSREAVDATRGEIVSYNGAPIDAFFFSTCGGRTAQGTEVFRAADRPYLQSISDRDSGGAAYCRISPRFEWTQTWTGSAFRSVLRRTLPEVAGVAAAEADRVSDVRVVRRSRSGRVEQLGIRLGRREVLIDEPQVRLVLRTPDGSALRSAMFTLTVERSGGRISRVVADGNGAGHGVGFCQWGAVGRARAGQEYHEIIAAYYPGTSVERLY